MRETRLWIFSMASTLLIVVLLGMHFALMHYSPVFYGQSIEHTRSFAELVARGRDAAQMVVYILFLGVALYHGLYGLRGILLELPVARSWDRPVSSVLLFIGIVFFAYGTYVTWWTFVLK